MEAVITGSVGGLMEAEYKVILERPPISGLMPLWMSSR